MDYQMAQIFIIVKKVWYQPFKKKIFFNLKADKK